MKPLRKCKHWSSYALVLWTIVNSICYYIVFVNTIYKIIQSLVRYYIIDTYTHGVYIWHMREYWHCTEDEKVLKAHLPIVRCQKGHNFRSHFAAKCRAIVWRWTFGIDKVTIGLFDHWRIVGVGKEPDLKKRTKNQIKAYGVCNLDSPNYLIFRKLFQS